MVTAPERHFERVSGLRLYDADAAQWPVRSLKVVSHC
jgi:hypothetical protein